MKRMTAVYSIAGLLIGALLSPAAAEPRGWNGAAAGTNGAPVTARGQLSAGPIVEGRNAALQQRTPMGVETYIARQIERDRRGDN